MQNLFLSFEDLKLMSLMINDSLMILRKEAYFDLIRLAVWSQTFDKIYGQLKQSYWYFHELIPNRLLDSVLNYAIFVQVFINSHMLLNKLHTEK